MCSEVPAGGHRITGAQLAQVTANLQMVCLRAALHKQIDLTLVMLLHIAATPHLH